MSDANTTPQGAGRRRLLDRVRDAIRLRHYSRRTEEAYVGWIRRSSCTTGLAITFPPGFSKRGWPVR